ncbi:hypothetical protein AB2S31_16175 [Elizabethkingia anophelis]|uniref:hypothetical protein n=2 Tax=Elizabethkingia anophelis TaxID=1117645 RepID=UPI002012A8A4|nr:hypothetical protein [Elizabethkingia anophelis]MCL1691393.1 hypothetical protein [Elizabethkingia anophelis]
MKNFRQYIILLLSGFTFIAIKSQTINWSSLSNTEKHILNANIGAEYGLIFGLGYGYKLNNLLFPIILGVEFSIPSGNNLFDDFKVKTGGNIRWLKIENIQLSTKLHSIFRRFENENVALTNFGLEMSGSIGYYRPHWFTIIEAGFDKAIVTHFKHSTRYQEIYPEVKNGWYEPATGGNFYYNLQGGYSFSNQDIYLKIGNIISQDFKTKPQLPYLLQIGYNYKLP